MEGAYHELHTEPEGVGKACIQDIIEWISQRINENTVNQSIVKSCDNILTDDVVIECNNGNSKDLITSIIDSGDGKSIVITSKDQLIKSNDVKIDI